MWPWQRNGEQPSHILIRRLLFLSSVGHIGLLMFLFVFYHDEVTNVSRDVIAVLLDTDVTIVKVPLTKVMHKKAPVIGAGKKAIAQAPAPAQKEAIPATGLSKPKIAIAKAKKISKSKTESKPKKEVLKPKEKPQAPKIAQVEPKKVEEKKLESLPPVEEQKIAQMIDQVAPEDQALVGDNVVYVGQHEYEALEVQRQIQQEAQRCWKAPLGIAADVACQIVVHVDHDGKVREVVIAKESGILMYDVRARQAVSQMEFPRGSWGKEVVVYFKQS